MRSRVSCNMLGSLPACNTSKNCSDGHSESCQIALPQNGAGHDCYGGPDIGEGTALGVNPRLVRDLEPEIGEGDAGAQLIAIIGWRIERTGPIRLRWRQTFRRQSVEFGRMEIAGAARRVKLGNSLRQLVAVQAQLAAKLFDRVSLVG